MSFLLKFIAVSLLALPYYLPTSAFAPERVIISPPWQPKIEHVAILTVESSNGENCREGKLGELSCFQILPATAELEKCPEEWKTSLFASAACASAWLKRGERVCTRWDWYARGRWYNQGKCMHKDSKPNRYEMDFARGRFKWFM